MAGTRKPNVVKFPPTPASIQSRIQILAKASENIIWTNHVKERMNERGISPDQVMRILQTGDVTDLPIVGKHDDEWKAKIVRKLPNGRSAGVVTLVIRDRRLCLLTAEWEDHL